MPTDDQSPEPDEIAEEENSDDDELSLDQLSQAYAKVIKAKKAESEEANGDTGSTEADDDPVDEEATADSVLEFAAAKQPKRRKQKSLEEIDAEDNAACPISPESILEAILFVGAPKDVKLTGRKIAAVMRDISPKEVKKMANELNKKYEKENTAYRVAIVDKEYRLELADDLLPLQNHFYGRDRAAKLSQLAIDVLAIVAYNQPVSKDEIERVRARNCGSQLNQLVKRGILVFEKTESKPVKRLYSTTDRFLDLFGLQDLGDLPQTSSVSDLDELAD